MGERICVKCGNIMEVVKTGFHHLGPDGEIRSSDLWGCKPCKRFQLHGIPSDYGGALYGVIRGQITPDPGGEPSTMFHAYLEPEIDFQPLFHKHMQEWYPDFKYKEKIL